MNIKISLAAVGLAFCALTSTAAAQPIPAAGSNQTIPEKDATRPEALRDRLGPSGFREGRSIGSEPTIRGVVKPNGDLDPGIEGDAPVPHPNSTRVIPPEVTGGENAR